MSSSKPTRCTVSTELAGKRLDACVKQLCELSWNAARDAISCGKISMAGHRVYDGALILQAGDSFDYTHNAPRPQKINELRADQIVFMDEHVIVVDKPAGIATVPYTDETDTLDARVRRYLDRRDLRKKGNIRPHLGIVHRIDKDTSGLVVFTRNFAAKRALSEQFRAHSVHRVYWAVTHGVPSEGRIENRIGHDRGDGLRGSDDEDGIWAVTDISVSEKFLPKGFAAFVHCRLFTGRTHQIRIHLSEAGHPLAGESVYIRDYSGPLISAPRLMLHAAELGFTHPSGKAMRFNRPPPQDMRGVLQRLRDRQ